MRKLFILLFVSLILRIECETIFDNFKTFLNLYISGQENCGRNQMYLECGTACPETCQTKDEKAIMCNKMCIPGCFCQQGYLRDVRRNNECVLEKDCSNGDL